jgi:hypothetical protein
VVSKVEAAGAVRRLLTSGYRCRHRPVRSANPLPAPPDVAARGAATPQRLAERGSAAGSAQGSLGEARPSEQAAPGPNIALA